MTVNVIGKSPVKSSGIPLPVSEDFVEARRRDMSPCEVAVERVAAEHTRVALYYEWQNRVSQ